MPLVFKEPETFNTPDGQEWIILPIQVDDMEPVFEVIEKRDKLIQKERAKKAKAEKIKEEEVTKVYIDGETFLKECGKEVKDMVDLSIINIKTGEPLPIEWRNPGNMMSWFKSIMRITMPDRKQDEDVDNPLEQSKN